MNFDPRKMKTNSNIRIRPLHREDRSRIEEVVVSSGKFTAVEIAVAMELVDEALRNGEASGYIVAVLEAEGHQPLLQGYVCYGHTPLTDGVYDLYWIVVDPASQGKGFGRRLLDFVEKDVVARDGRMLLIETSSQQTYDATIRFYQGSGYELAARIKNFYRIGDDKLVFSKELT
jgi:ribosomal protein S18 acetylase RimI-like enzyme